MRPVLTITTHGESMRLAKAELENKTVLITGAGSQGGIGADAAELLAEEGARVLVTGRHRERGEQVVKTITAAGGNARFLLADLSKLDDVHRLADEAGEVDVLVNNAAAYALGSSLELTAENYTAMYDTNVRAPFLLVQRLAFGHDRSGIRQHHQHQHDRRSWINAWNVVVRVHQGRHRVAHPGSGRPSSPRTTSGSTPWRRGPSTPTMSPRSWAKPGTNSRRRTPPSASDAHERFPRLFCSLPAIGRPMSAAA